MMRKKNFKVRQITRFFALFLIVAMVFGCVHPAITARADEDVSVVAQTEESFNEEEMSETTEESESEVAESEESEIEETKQTEEDVDTTDIVGSAEGDSDDDAEESETESELVMESETDAEKESETEEKSDFAKLTVKEQYEAILSMSDKEIEAALGTLTEDQFNDLMEYAASKHEPTYVRTIPFANAASFKAPVTVKTSRRRLLKAAKGGSGDAPDGLVIDKKATVNPDGSYTITLDTYTTGTVTTSTQSVPVDIVLVLDQSGSMQYGFNGNSASYSNSRQKAMQDAVKNFIDAVGEKYDATTSDHRISIVTFGSNVESQIPWTAADSNGVGSLKQFIDDLGEEPEGATNVAAGMGRAQHLLSDELNYNGANTTRQKVCVVFTDGVPTTSTDFNTTVATGAINAGKNIKSGGAAIYTVGIFTGADIN